MASYDSDEIESSSSFDFKGLAYGLWERSWLVALCLVAAGFVTYGYLKRAPRIYAASAVLKVGQEAPKIITGIEDVEQNDRPGPDNMKTIEQELQSRALLERVIATNNLDKDARFVGDVKVEKTPAQLASLLASMIKISGQPGTRILKVTVEHQERELTAQIANSIITEYARKEFEQKNLIYGVAEDWLKQEETQWRVKVEQSERAKQAFREKNPSLDEGQDIVKQKYKTLGQNVTEARSDLIKRETEYNYLAKLGTNINQLLTVSIVASDPSVSAIATRISTAEVEFGNLKLRYKERHPKYVAANNELMELKASLYHAVTKVVETARNAFVAAQNRESAMVKELKEQEEAVLKLGELNIQYTLLSRELESNRSFYESVQKRLKETKISEKLPDNGVQLVNKAYVPDKPIKPDKIRIIIMGIIGGLGLGVGLAMGLYMIDSSLKSPDEAEEFLKIPLLCTVPQVRDVEKGKRQIIMGDEAACVESENFRTLRTTLGMLGPEVERRTFLFTSAVPDEGKTFCAVNYAVCLAQQGLKTLLIEADLRCPVIAETFQLGAAKVPGVTEYLAQKEKFDSIIQATNFENLFFIPAGHPAPNPSELLSRKGFQILMDKALAEFDRIVVDSAPVQPVSDTLLIVGRVQTVCLVVRAHKTPRKVSERALAALQKARAPLAGFLLNGVSKTRASYYTYDYNYYASYTRKDKEEVRA